jgi:redox-sensing transcriptional repressor
MSYYRVLTEWTAKKPIQTVTSAQLGEALDIDPTQVRKDLAAIGAVGMGRVGFEVCEVCRAVRTVLGFNESHEAILIGAGHLGGALLAYGGFARYGVKIVAAFDNNQRRIGTRIGGLTIRPMRALRPFMERHGVQFAILTTPVEVSQKITDRLVGLGVKAIWNFTPTQLIVPEDVLVRHEHISTGLSELAYHLKHCRSG